MKSHTLRHWLKSRNLEDLPLQLRLADLSKPDQMHDRQVVVDAMVDAIRSGTIICSFSDYDCDGMGSNVIITEGLRELGARIVPVIASRFAGGYGVSDEACERILGTGAKVVITLDCGSSNHTQIRYLQSKGLRVYVVDHHLVPEEKLPAEGFINPHKPECGHTFKWMCTGGLALSVLAGVRTSMSAQIDLKYYLDMVAIATIADVQQLTGDNRILVAQGLEQLRQARRPGIKALLEIAKLDTKFPFTGRDIAWRIAPLLNAPGRLGPPDVVVQLLMARDLEEARGLALELQRLSNVRRDMTDEIQREAEEEIAAAGYDEHSAITVGRESWGHGIVGITAGRLSDKYRVPVCVFGSEGKGSVRGPAGSQLHSMLTDCKDYLVKFGGHQAAAGAEVHYERLEAFREAFCQAATNHPAQPLGPRIEPLKLDTRDNLKMVLLDLEQLEPCGEGNSRPKIVAEGTVTSAKDVKGHLSLEIQMAGGQKLKGFLVNEGKMVKTLQGKVSLAGDLRPTSYGTVGVEMFVDKLEII